MLTLRRLWWDGACRRCRTPESFNLGPGDAELERRPHEIRMMLPSEEPAVFGFLKLRRPMQGEDGAAAIIFSWLTHLLGSRVGVKTATDPFSSRPNDAQRTDVSFKTKLNKTKTFLRNRSTSSPCFTLMRSWPETHLLSKQ